MKFWRLGVHTLMLLCSSMLRGEEQPVFNQMQFEQQTGFKGTYNAEEKAFKTTFPRIDVKVAVDQRVLDPYLGLTSWAAFTQKDKQEFLVMGDFVLFQDEVNPVIAVLLEQRLHITALHNHFFYDQPRVYFMHIEGLGPLNQLAQAIRAILTKIREIRVETVRPKETSDGIPRNFSNGITAAPLESILGLPSESSNGMVKFVVGGKAVMHDVALGKLMGINSWAAFGGSDINAVVDGDFALQPNEMDAVLSALLKGGIQVVAIHNHMIGEKPSFIFIHYWGMGKAENLAKTIKSALEVRDKKDQKDQKDLKDKKAVQKK